MGHKKIITAIETIRKLKKKVTLGLALSKAPRSALVIPQFFKANSACVESFYAFGLHRMKFAIDVNLIITTGMDRDSFPVKFCKRNRPITGFAVESVLIFS